MGRPPKPTPVLPEIEVGERVPRKRPSRAGIVQPRPKPKPRPPSESHIRFVLSVAEAATVARSLGAGPLRERFVSAVNGWKKAEEERMRVLEERGVEAAIVRDIERRAALLDPKAIPLVSP